MIVICKDGTTLTATNDTVVTSRGEYYVISGNCLLGPCNFLSHNVFNINDALHIIAGLHGGKYL